MKMKKMGCVKDSVTLLFVFLTKKTFLHAAFFGSHNFLRYEELERENEAIIKIVWRKLWRDHESGHAWKNFPGCYDKLLDKVWYAPEKKAKKFCVFLNWTIQATIRRWFVDINFRRKLSHHALFNFFPTGRTFNYKKLIGLVCSWTVCPRMKISI